MDSLRGQADLDGDDADDFGAIEPPPMIQSQERRMHVRAYNYWVSLLGNRALPSIEDLNPEDTQDFSANSVLLDFSMGLENPAILYLGSAVREECGITGPIERVADVPPRSLLTRLTDHYLQIIANAAPVGFEAEFVNQRGVSIQYRGILMPFSSDDETIDFIYGVINWKEAVSDSLREQLDAEMEAALASSLPRSAAPIWAEGPSATSDFATEGRAEEYLDDLIELDDLDALVDEAGASPGEASALADDGDFGFDEEPTSHPAETDALADLPPLDLDGFASEDVESSAMSEPDDALDELDALGSLDDLLAMPDAATPVDDALDLAAFLMPDSGEDATAGAAQAAEPVSDDFDLDDLLAELAPEAEDKGGEPDPVAEEADEDTVETAQNGIDDITDITDIDDILAGMDFDSPAPPVPAQASALGASTQDAEEHALDDIDLTDISDLSDLTDLDALLAVTEVTDEASGDAAEDAPHFSSLELEQEIPEHILRETAEGDLADVLAAARSSAAEVRDCDARSRAALYRAIGHAHDFALSAQGAPADYAEMLEDAGIVVQERSPMTAVVKLVFGADYDKTRLAEYALALDHANETGMMRGELAELLAHYKGGLKGLVQDRRAARKGVTESPASRSLRRLDRAVRKLNRAKIAETSALPFGELGLAVVIARREDDGSISLVAGVSLEDKAAQKVMIAASKGIGRKRPASL